MHWSTVPIRTNKDAVLIWKSSDKTANKPRKLAGRNGDKPTKTRIDVTYVDFCHMVQEVAELCISQLGRQLKTVIVITFLYCP